MVKMPACHAGDSGFDSRMRCKRNWTVQKWSNWTDCKSVASASHVRIVAVQLKRKDTQVGEGGGLLSR